MKKLTLVAMALMGTSAVIFAQSTIPAVTKAAFSQKFPGIKKVKWYEENSHLYEAAFTKKGKHYTADFNETGEWLETESPSTFKQLPLKVKQAFNAEHKGAKIKDVSSIVTLNKGQMYEVEIKQGSKPLELLYNADGTPGKE